MMWDMLQAMVTVKTVQDVSRRFGYHVALGGGVLNRGTSDKDIDLYFLPLDDAPVLAEGMHAWLVGLWGPSTPIGDARYPPSTRWSRRETFIVDSNKRIDVFIH